MDYFTPEKLVEHISNKLTKNYRSHLELILTTKCNLRCTYCFESETDRTKTMSKEVGFSALNEFVRSDLPIPQNIVFFGGEPFLNWELFRDLVLHARKLQENPRRLELSTVTNATIIPSGAEDFLAANDVLIMVSLDLGENNHDRHRVTNKGEGTFDKVISGIQRFVKAGNEVVIRSTINPEGAGDLISSYEICKKLGASSWYLSRVTGGEWEEKDLITLKSSFKKLSSLYAKDRECNENTMKVAQLDYIKDRVINKPCNAGKFNIAVDPMGSIYGCSRLATTAEPMGSLKLGSLNSIIDDSNLYRLRNAVDNSGCPAINYDETGSYYLKSSTDINIREMFSELETSQGD